MKLFPFSLIKETRNELDFQSHQFAGHQKVTAKGSKKGSKSKKSCLFIRTEMN